MFTYPHNKKTRKEGNPRIEVLTRRNTSLVPSVIEGNLDHKERQTNDHLEFVSMTLQSGEEIIVGRRLREILSSARNSAPKAT